MPSQFSQHFLSEMPLTPVGQYQHILDSSPASIYETLGKQLTCSETPGITVWNVGWGWAR